MSELEPRRRRLHELLDLSLVYRGWTQTELARALNCDRSRLYRDTDNPKLDLVVGLADVLEWPVDAVVEYLWTGIRPGTAPPQPGADFDALDAAAHEAFRAGDHARVLEIARRLAEMATTPEQRARASRREYGAWDSMGRYTKALHAIQNALRQSALPTDLRLTLQVNLANAHYTLGEFTPAFGIAHALVEWFGSRPPQSLRECATQAFAYYVRGHTAREQIADQPECAAEHADRARADLERSAELHEGLAERHKRTDFRAIANTCRGGALEARVALGDLPADAAISEVLGMLDAGAGNGEVPAGDWLESLGWCCVFGARIALRGLGGRELQRTMAIFTEKALEFANRLDNWALRERVFTMQYAANRTLSEMSGLKMDLMIDDDEMRLIAGTIGRFPGFRGLGLDILRNAKVVRNGIRN